MRSWLTGRSPATSSAPLNAGDELKALESAMHGAALIMNDDIEAAERELSQGSSPFHYLGLGVVGFMQAILGLEKDVMAEASKRLYEAETRASDSHRASARQSAQTKSSIYAPGSEYLLCQAQTQIMGAVVGVLTESVTEAIKGFYKLRKAFVTLEAIVQQEQTWLERHKARPDGQLSTRKADAVQTSETTKQTAELGDGQGEPDSDVDEFFDVAEDAEQIPEAVEKASRPSTAIDENFDKLTIKSNGHSSTVQAGPAVSRVPDGPDVELFEAPMDAFIHSSTCMCYGMLLLLLSLLPPAFSTLIKIAGFRGDRVRGIALLWQAAKFNNINGAFAGLILLGYYNGFIGFCDILPAEGSASLPKERCVELLHTSVQRFPKSCLWMLEQTRMLANERKLTAALERQETMPPSNLLQLQALHCFEQAMNYLNLHKYEECSKYFEKMTTLNNWSHGLYYYISGCCQVELYRLTVATDASKAAEYAKEAQRIFKTVPEHLGKKKIMARQLPFDVFVQRKLDKWSQRAKDHNLSVVDAVGVSPTCEMIYFWNGYKRMDDEQLELCLKRLDWSCENSKVPWKDEAVDEKALRSLLAAVVFRNLGKTQAARKLMQRDIIDQPATAFKGNFRDNWTPPSARYETAATYWQDHLKDGKKEFLEQSQQLLQSAAGWETYDLDTRVGIRIKTGLDTVRKRREALG